MRVFRDIHPEYLSGITAYQAAHLARLVHEARSVKDLEKVRLMYVRWGNEQ